MMPVIDQALPEHVVLVDVMLEMFVDRGTIVAPRISSEQLVAAGSRQHDLDEFAGQLGGVEIRVALSDAGLLDVPGEALA